MASAGVREVQFIPSVEEAATLSPTAANKLKDGDHAIPSYHSVFATTILSVQLVPLVEVAPFVSPADG